METGVPLLLGQVLVISLASHGGAHLMGVGVQKVLLALCGATMLFFGFWFLRDVIARLSAAA